jgi:hypothetical protein
VDAVTAADEDGVGGAVYTALVGADGLALRDEAHGHADIHAVGPGEWLDGVGVEVGAGRLGEGEGRGRLPGGEVRRDGALDGAKAVDADAGVADVFSKDVVVEGDVEGIEALPLADDGALAGTLPVDAVGGVEADEHLPPLAVLVGEDAEGHGLEAPVRRDRGVGVEEGGEVVGLGVGLLLRHPDDVVLAVAIELV